MSPAGTPSEPAVSGHGNRVRLVIMTVSRPSTVDRQLPVPLLQPPIVLQVPSGAKVTRTPIVESQCPASSVAAIRPEPDGEPPEPEPDGEPPEPEIDGVTVVR
ncbi:MAG TPA: hypothetical protein VHN80_01510, partial [Kineosporiaceae bacterium]|nr:hypothetical protein [Kineosporiaceae bacterium]